MTKLYTVTIEHEYVIAVEDDEDPYDVAEETFRDVKYDLDLHSVDLNVTEFGYFPSGWDGECYPYRCEAQERKIGDILKESEHD